jgi:type IV protein arginine methyltransferase
LFFSIASHSLALSTLISLNDHSQIDRIFQSLSPKPRRHIIIEAHPQVLDYIRDTGFDKIPGVTILEGRWQDWINDKKIADVMKLTAPAPSIPADKKDAQVVQHGEEEPENDEDWESYGTGFDAVFVDTFAEGYEGD